MSSLIRITKNYFTASSVFVLLVFFSCSKKADTNPTEEETISGISLNQWKFSANGQQFTGRINFAYLSQGLGLTLEAKTFNSNDTSLFFHMGFSGSEIMTGYYSTASLPNNSIFYMADLNTVGIFDANPYNASYGTVIFQVLSYDNNTRQVKGKFSGSARYNYSAISNITDGAFWAVVQ